MSGVVRKARETDEHKIKKRPSKKLGVVRKALE
jgi:hypothetical protein